MASGPMRVLSQARRADPQSLVTTSMAASYAVLGLWPVGSWLVAGWIIGRRS